MVFFCKGVIEMVKKFGWVLDVVFCNGWMMSFILLYFKMVYKNELFFQNVKVVYFIYNGFLEKIFLDVFMVKVFINNLIEDDLSVYQNGKGVIFYYGVINFVDVLIQGSEQIDDSVSKVFFDIDKFVLDYQGEEGFEVLIKEFFEIFVIEEVEESQFKKFCYNINFSFVFFKWFSRVEFFFLYIMGLFFFYFFFLGNYFCVGKINLIY